MGIRHAVIPAGGRGTRMLPVTRAVPKELLPLGVTPLLDVILDELAAAGLTEIVVVDAPGKPALRAYLEDRPEIRCIAQPEPLGLGDAVLRAAELIGDEPFVVALPDALLPDGLLRSLLARAERDADGAIALEPVPAERAHSYGIAELDGDGVITRLIEKPAPGELAPGPALAVAARYVLPARTFDALRETAPGRGGEIQLTDAIAALVAGGGRLAGVTLAPRTRRRDVGSPAGYAAAFAEHALADLQLAPHVLAAIDDARRDR